MTEVAGSPPPTTTGQRPARSTGARRVWLTWGRRALTVVLVGVAGWAAYGHRTEIATASAMLGHLRVPWLVVAIGCEAASMVVFAGLQRWLLRAGGVTVGIGSMLEIVLAGNAMSTSLPGGAAWAAAWAFGQLRRRDTTRVLAGWVILVAGALSSFAIFVIVTVGAWVAGSRGPAAPARWPLAGLAAIPVVLAIGVVAAGKSRTVRHLLAASWGALARRAAPARAVGRLARRTVDDIALVQPGATGWAWAFGLAMANWLSDAAVLVACIEALGLHLPWRGVLVVYGLTQVSASLPVTPGGLGVVEGSMTALLVGYGTPAAAAFAVVLLYRIVSFWGLVPIGWGSWLALELADRGGLRHRPHPWTVHLHGGRPVPEVGARGPARLLAPAPCTDCTEADGDGSDRSGERVGAAAPHGP